MMNKKGQIAIWLTILGSVAVAVISGWFGQASRTDAKLEIAKSEQTANVLEISQRVTANETKVDNIQSDLREVKSDVKELLKRVK